VSPAREKAEGTTFSALSVAAAAFLILELDGAFEGIIRISSEPFRYTLANLGR
jgi:hypothetical protein